MAMTSSAEERHTISEPRLVKNSSNDTSNELISWEVDIYRQGVESPIDTVLINNETLPPRYNRKGKVVWRLPDEADKIPSFGLEDKKRIMDLFKHQKKTRRKALKTSSSGTSVSNNDSNNAKSASNDIKSDPEYFREEKPTETIGDDSNGEVKNLTKIDSNGEAKKPPPGFSNQKEKAMAPQQQQPMLIDVLYFVIPSNTLPNLLPTTIAKSFISTYYLYFTPTTPHISKLVSFYTPTAQKSISIGEAHSVVISKQEIYLQLQHFQQTITFTNIIGVVAQMSHNAAIHLLITGNAKQHQQQYCRSFAHSIQLVRSRSEGDFYGYQIQNDALALLNEVIDGVVVDNKENVTDAPS